MSKRTILLTPVDAWFFRDGRPYNQGESGQTDARSLFPPFSPTIVGVIRAALARERGWSGRGDWNTQLAASDREILGKSLDDLGRLQFSGPFLSRQGQFLFPIPQYLLGTMVPRDARSQEPRWSPATFLGPASEKDSTLCDLGDVRLPEPQRPAEDGTQYKEPAGLWITVDGYNQLLGGQLPDATAIVRSADLWSFEPRVGLRRNHESRLAEEGQLYSPQYVRLAKDVSLAVVVKGVPDDWQLPSLVTFGGEGRMAYCEKSPDPLALPSAPTDSIRKSLQFTVTLLTPLYLNDESHVQTHPLPGQEFPDLTGSHIVSACVGKPIQIGGWNSLDRRPMPLRAFLPAGSSWFCAANQDAIDAILDMHGKRIGGRTQHGLGQIALGAWPQPNGEKS